MMSKLLASTVVVGLLLASTSASADEPKLFGVQADIGYPDGLALGINLRPGLSWAHLNLSATRALGWGFRTGLTLEPFDSFVSPTLTGECGITFTSKLIGYENIPKFNYQYCNLHLGLDFGSVNTKFFIHAGPSWIFARTENFSEVIGNRDNSLTISNPNADFVIFPTGKIGFLTYF